MFRVLSGMYVSVFCLRISSTSWLPSPFWIFFSPVLARVIKVNQILLVIWRSVSSLKKYFNCAVEIFWFRRNIKYFFFPFFLLLPFNVNYLNCAVEILWLMLNDLHVEYLRDGLKFVFSPDIISNGWLGSKHQLTASVECVCVCKVSERWISLFQPWYHP